jgi:hypothetical protein
MNESTTTYSQYWSPSMIADEYLRFSKKLTASLVATPPESFPRIQTDHTVEQQKTALRSLNRAFGLVYSGRENDPKGWVEWEESRKSDPVQHAFPPDIYLKSDAGMHDAMRWVENRGVAVLREKAGGVQGLIFPRDFNKPAARSFLYQWLITLEIELDIRIQKELDQAQCMALLTERAKEEWLRTYEFEKERNPKVRMMDCMTFRNRLTIARRSNFFSESFSEVAWSLGNMRNAVMHPVNPFIAGRKDLAAVNRNYNQIKKMISMIRRG